jgi:transposase InsO family protein
MEERLRFVEEARHGRWTMVELCERYGVSRTTGYKWLERYAEMGRRGLADQSRAPHSCPHATDPAVVELLVELRRERRDWGARKLLRVLERRHPEITAWPAPSTATELLARRGLVRQARRRVQHPHPGVVRIETQEPNDLWTADFKGEFKTSDGVYCYPLTIADQHSRYLLSCHGLRSTRIALARPVFERAFREYGLPRAIRTDNGVPFATIGLGGLSALNVWWLALGISHQRIQPGRPSQNGAHERMHRTLKRQATRPPRASLPAQQRAFNAFRQEYNSERPHEALGMETPASCYRASQRPYPKRLGPPEYPGHFITKKITTGGTFRFHNRVLYLANALTGYVVGLDEVDDGLWHIFFNTVLIATLDVRDYIIRG